MWFCEILWNIFSNIQSITYQLDNHSTHACKRGWQIWHYFTFQTRLWVHENPCRTHSTRVFLFYHPNVGLFVVALWGLLGLLSLYIKNGISLTPRNWFLKAFTFALKLSAEAFVERFSNCVTSAQLIFTIFLLHLQNEYGQNSCYFRENQSSWDGSSNWIYA